MRRAVPVISLSMRRVIFAGLSAAGGWGGAAVACEKNPVVTEWPAPMEWQAEAQDPLLSFLRGRRGFQANFTQHTYDARGRSLEQADGEVYLIPPGKFRWVYTAPYEQQIVSDGETLWLYDADLEQLIIRPMMHSAATPAAIFSGEAVLRRHFDVQVLGLAAGYHWVDLVPVQEDVEYRFMRLAFADGLPARMILEDHFGQCTHIDFLVITADVALAESLFTVRTPPGVDIVDERPAGMDR